MCRACWNSEFTASRPYQHLFWRAGYKYRLYNPPPKFDSCTCRWAVVGKTNTETGREERFWVTMTTCPPCIKTFFRVAKKATFTGQTDLEDVYGNRYHYQAAVVDAAKPGDTHTKPELAPMKDLPEILDVILPGAKEQLGPKPPPGGRSGAASAADEKPPKGPPAPPEGPSAAP